MNNNSSEELYEVELSEPLHPKSKSKIKGYIITPIIAMCRWSLQHIVSIIINLIILYIAFKNGWNKLVLSYCGCEQIKSEVDKIMSKP